MKLTLRNLKAGTTFTLHSKTYLCSCIWRVVQSTHRFTGSMVVCERLEERPHKDGLCRTISDLKHVELAPDAQVEIDHLVEGLLELECSGFSSAR